MKSFIDEARKNPNQNPRVPAFQQIIDNGYDTKDHFITFAHFKKVGINPTSGFDTPNGIYTYPALEIMKEVRGNMRNVPHGANSPYIHVLKKRGSGIIDPLESYSKAQYKKDRDKLFNMITKKKSLPMNQEGEDLVNWIMDEAKKDAMFNTPIAWMWNTTKELSANPDISAFMGWGGVQSSSFRDHYFDPYAGSRKAGKKHKKFLELPKGGVNYNSQGWNNLLRMLGYKAFVDRSGSGLLHRNEPIQAVFLTSKSFVHVDSIENKSYERLSRQGKYQKDIETLTKRGNLVNFTGKLSGNAELAFYQIMDSDIEGCTIDFFKGKMHVSGMKIGGGDISKGDFDSPAINFTNIRIRGGYFKDSNGGFEDCSVIDGTFVNIEFNGTELIGGKYYDCMFNKIEVVSRSSFHSCRFISGIMLYDCDFRQCNLQGCGFTKCEVSGGYISGSTLTDGNSFSEGVKMDQVKINGGRYVKCIIERSTITGGVFFRCRLTNTTVQDGTFNNIIKGNNLKIEGGEWNEDI